MCLFGGGGGSSSSSGPVSKGPSDQTAAQREENYRTGVAERDSYGRTQKNRKGRTYAANSGRGTLLTVGTDADSNTGVKTLLGG